MNDTITEINKDTFWGLIREAKDACGQDMSAMVEYLKGRLVSMGAEQAQSFHDITQAYRPSQRPSFRLRMLPSPLARFLLM